jgi:ABC-2 type transport system permease protein
MRRAFVGLLRKEFIQIFRDKFMLRLIFVMPVLQLLVLGYAINTDVKHIQLDVYDFDQSTYSRQLIQALQAGDYFDPALRLSDPVATPLWELDQRFKNGHSEMALIIPPDFSERLSLKDSVTVGLVADGSDANAARAGLGYASQIVRTFSKQVTGMEPPLEVRSSFRFNPESESKYFMVPGVVVTLLTMISMMLTAMAIVREREMGTLEQVLVTPMRPIVLLMGKITAFAILSVFEMCIALSVGMLWFGVPFVGSPILLFALAGLYLLTTLGLGMFVSTVTSTQQQAMFMVWFFSIFTMLTSGFFTPISNMPVWLQQVTIVNPMKYFLVIVRGIIMKGSTLDDLLPNVIALVIFGVTLFAFSILRFHKRAA